MASWKKCNKEREWGFFLKYILLLNNGHRTSNIHHRVSAICWGRRLSITSTSLENRDKIRPWGVTSWKDRGARTTPWSMTSCMTLAAYHAPRRGATSEMNRVTARLAKTTESHQPLPQQYIYKCIALFLTKLYLDRIQRHHKLQDRYLLCCDPWCGCFYGVFHVPHSTESTTNWCQQHRPDRVHWITLWQNTTTNHQLDNNVSTLLVTPEKQWIGQH